MKKTTYSVKFLVVWALSVLMLPSCEMDERLPVGPPATGIVFSVSDGEKSVATRGDPVTSENIDDMYADNIGVIAFNHSSGMTYIPAGPLMAPTASEPRWHTAEKYFWPENDELDFWAWAPLRPTSGNGLEPVFSQDGRQLSFSYSLPLPDPVRNFDAAGQPDIILAHSLGDRFSMGGGVSLSFLHPLSSIAFKAGETCDGVIRSITLKGVLGSGECSFDGTSFTWTQTGEPLAYTQTFDADADFMMIPQILGESAAIEVAFDDGTGTDTYSYSLSGKTWMPGKRYTYSISIIIDDGAGLIEIKEEFDGDTKRNVRVKNNSDQPQYLRMLVVANWVNGDGDIVSSCDFGKEGSMSGYNVTSIGGRWTLHTDGFTYYKKAIAAGRESRSLFSAYSPPPPPAPGCHLEMTVLVQAVEYNLNQKKAESAWGVNLPLAGSIE